jgi:hypothetical protein
MRILKYILLAILPLMISCEKDPMDTIKGSDWHKQKDIIEILFEGQIGTAEITRAGNLGQINFMYDMNYGEVSSVKLAGIVSSYGSSSSVMPGETLNFSNDNKASITITPGQGEPMVWNIELIPFLEPLSGSFNVKDIRVFIDVISHHPEWGGHTKDDPIRNYLPEAAAEYDNTVTFDFVGINAQGNSYGTFNHGAGADGQYGEFTNEAEGVDLNAKYRVLPKGEGTWTRNPSDNTVTFTDGSGKTTRGELIQNNGTYSIRFEYVVDTDWDTLWQGMTQIRQMTKYMWYVIESE